MQAYRLNILKMSLLCLVPFVYMGLFIGSYTDDAFITLSYVKTLVQSHTWGMHAGHVSNAATSPLHVLLLSALTVVVRDPLIGLYLFDVGVVFAFYFVFRRISRNSGAPEAWPLLATVLLYVNPLLVSTQGLESYLYLLMLVVTCMLHAEDRHWLAGVACGLLYLARPDGCLAAVVLAVACISQRKWRGLVFLLPLMLIGLVWTWVSWKYLGSPIPDTFFIKQGQIFQGGFTFFSGLLFYFSRFPIALALSFAPGIALLFYRPTAWSPFGKIFWLLLTAYVTLHFAGYALLRVPPFHWYYAPEAAFCALAGSLGSACHIGKKLKGSNLAIALLVFGSLIPVLMSIFLTSTLPISTNWANANGYRKIAEWLNRNIQDDKIALRGELGVLQYYTRADMIDEFSDRSFIDRRYRKTSDSFARQLIGTAFENAQAPSLTDIHYGLAACRSPDYALQTWLVESPWGGGSHICLYRLKSVTGDGWEISTTPNR
jgi:hypothetical protein